MKRVKLASTEPATRLFRVLNSLQKKYDASVLDPMLKAQKSKLFGKVISAALRWPLYSLQILLTNSDILHFFDSPNFVAIPMIHKKCKFVFDYRTFFSEKLGTDFPPLVNAAYWVEGKLVKRADVILTVNDILADILRNRYKEKPLVVPNYPLKSFVSTRNKREIRDDMTKPLVLFHARFSHVIDFENLLKCAKKMKECEFWLIGDGPFRGWAEQHASPNVKFLGFIPHEEIPDYINACDVGIVPIKPVLKSPISNDQDLLKVGELAALRKPIVASGVAPSSQYLLVKPEELSKGIEEALSGNVPPPIPHYWEDHSEKILFEAYDSL
jgi:glycosyltransferase involved in cell wall biosynthesis